MMFNLFCCINLVFYYHLKCYCVNVRAQGGADESESPLGREVKAIINMGEWRRGRSHLIRMLLFGLCPQPGSAL